MQSVHKNNQDDTTSDIIQEWKNKITNLIKQGETSFSIYSVQQFNGMPSSNQMKLFENTLEEVIKKHGYQISRILERGPPTFIIEPVPKHTLYHNAQNETCCKICGKTTVVPKYTWCGTEPFYFCKKDPIFNS